MPEYSYGHRMVMSAESDLWTAITIISSAKSGIHNDVWRQRMQSALDELEVVARDMRDFNDQFETEDD